jgi:perosamine synthetase
MAWRIPVARPDIGDAELEAVRAVIERRWLTQGPEVRAFEAAFARFCRVEHAVATNTGTGALHVALLALEIGSGDEVITTPLSCIASANPILFQGASPVFADIDRDTYNLDPADVEKRITPRTKAILPVHLFGHPADMDPLLEMAERHRLPVIEDASQAAGAEYKGRRVGGLGTVAAFSLYANKIVTAGEGGMLTTPDARLAERMIAIRNFGQPAGRHFLHPFLGGNYKMSDLHAAIGRVQLDRVERFIEQRRRNVVELGRALAPLRGLIDRLPSEQLGHRAVPFAYHLLFRSAAFRDAADEALRAASIETRPFFSLINDQIPYRALGFDPIDTPVAADVFSRGLYISNSPDLTDDERGLIVETLTGVAQTLGAA